ncbi:protoporphyrinogen oxidase [Bacillus horti]|uniref:Coproporphyrinogen III oxidase n=2 Tax=Caldalkalibacillus horti TaxID=77523 RepID=A0ABT9VUC1_9BACI|nr:protoporphyrinogen oxidase [Bacillus horti]MDQ0164480.1 oxygen-dependent protoporphyrinogen oxidase [Bacillus horti]
MGDSKKIVIIGGGITGLSAAFYLDKLAEVSGTKHQITVLEQSDQLGGKIQTIRKDGFVIEKGPDSFLSRKLPAYELAKELGIEGELVGTNPAAKKTYILHKGRFHRMPQGLNLGIPTEISPFATTGLISPAGKLRALMDIVLPKKQEDKDESLGHFLHRRLGKEVLERVAEPLLAGIYAGDTYKLSLKATFPQFRQMEQRHRSLILGMKASMAKAGQTENLPDIVKQSRFLSFRNGLQTLVDHLVADLQKNDIQLLTKTKVQSVTHAGPSPDGVKKSPFQVILDGGESIPADSIILALPTKAISNLLSSTFPMAEELEKIQYVSVANVIMTFNREDIQHSLDGSGFVVPRKEKTSITACTWTSSKWGHTAPDGKVVIRCYVGRSGDEEIAAEDDDVIIARVQKDLENLMGIKATPLFYAVNRWPNSMPQYPVGHLELVEKVRKELSAYMPGVYMVGAGFGGVGVPDCIRQGKGAAQQAYAHLLKA